MAQVAEQLEQQQDLLQSLLLFWGALKTSSFLGHLVKGPEYVAFRIQRGPPRYGGQPALLSLPV